MFSLYLGTFLVEILKCFSVELERLRNEFNLPLSTATFVVVYSFFFTGLVHFVYLVDCNFLFVFKNLSKQSSILLKTLLELEIYLCSIFLYIFKWFFERISSIINCWCVPNDIKLLFISIHSIFKTLLINFTLL